MNFSKFIQKFTICLALVLSLLNLSSTYALADGKLPNNYNQLVAQGAIHNQVTSDGNPVFPEINLGNPFVDTTGKASQHFISEMKQKSDIILEKGYQFGGFIYYDSPNEIWEVANDYGNYIGIGDAKNNNGLSLVIALNKQGKRSGLAPGSFLAVGKGIQGLIPDSKLGKFYSQVYNPTLLSTGSWEEAHLAFMDSVVEALTGEGSTVSDQNIDSTIAAIAILVPIAFVLLVLVVGLIASLCASSDNDDDYPSGGGSGGDRDTSNSFKDWTSTDYKPHRQKRSSKKRTTPRKSRATSSSGSDSWSTPSWGGLSDTSSGGLDSGIGGGFGGGDFGGGGFDGGGVGN